MSESKQIVNRLIKERGVGQHEGGVIRLSQSAAPFANLHDNLGRAWRRIVRKAGILDLSIHDLRRTYITRQIQDGVPLPTVQRPEGHADIKRALKFYDLVAEEDLRAALRPTPRIFTVG